jgi:hypothetical protein
VAVAVCVGVNAQEELEHSAGEDDNLQDLLWSRNEDVRNVSICIKDSEAVAYHSGCFTHAQPYRARLVCDVWVPWDMDPIVKKAAVVLSSIVARIVVITGRDEFTEKMPMDDTCIHRDGRSI